MNSLGARFDQQPDRFLLVIGILDGGADGVEYRRLASGVFIRRRRSVLQQDIHRFNEAGPGSPMQGSLPLVILKINIRAESQQSLYLTGISAPVSAAEINKLASTSTDSVPGTSIRRVSPSSRSMMSAFGV
jgi:hypothetical protein